MERPRRIMTSIMSIEDKNYVHHLELYCNCIEGNIQLLEEGIYNHEKEIKEIDAAYEKGFDDGILIYNQLERDEYERYLNLPEEERLKVDKAILRISKEVFDGKTKH